MMLEEMQDRAAYPLRYTIKHPGMTPMELAKKEMKAQGMTPGALPKGKKEIEQVPGRRLVVDRLCDVLRDGPMTNREISAALGCAYTSAYNATKKAEASGHVVAIGDEGRYQKFGLPAGGL